MPWNMLVLKGWPHTHSAQSIIFQPIIRDLDLEPVFLLAVSATNQLRRIRRLQEALTIPAEQPVWCKPHWKVKFDCSVSAGWISVRCLCVCVRVRERDFALPRFACWLSCSTHVSAECQVTAISDAANTLKRDQCSRARCVHGALYMTFGTTGCRARTQVWQPHLLPSFSFMFSGVVKHRRDKGSYLFVLRDRVSKQEDVAVASPFRYRALLI